MPQATSSDSPNVTTAPNIAMLAAERRGRALVAARTNARSGTRTVRGTAQTRVVAGSKWKPVAARAPDAAPEAAVRTLPTAISRLSARSPDPGAQARARPPRAAPATAS